MTEPEIFNKEKGKPLMSRFFCQEIMFEYMDGSLPPERRKIVADYLKTDEVCREDLARLERARAYCGKLAQVELPAPWMKRWRNFPPALAKRISDLEMKLVGRFWRWLPAVVTVLLVGVGLATFKPWKSLFTKEITVWTFASPEAAKVSVVEDKPNPDGAAPAVVATTIVEEKSTPVSKSEPVVEKQASPAATGLVYRESMTIDDLDGPRESIEAKIEELGGQKHKGREIARDRKDGSVEFQFTLPESNFEPLSEFLRSLGPVRISQQKDPLVMQEGTIRIILIVKENAKDAPETAP